MKRLERQVTNLKMLAFFILLDLSHQAKFTTKIFRIINDFHKDVTNKKIVKKLYTEDNLMTLLEMFNLSVHGAYEPDVKDKIDFLYSHFYEKVREQELKARKANRRKVENGCHLVSIFNTFSY